MAGQRRLRRGLPPFPAQSSGHRLRACCRWPFRFSAPALGEIPLRRSPRTRRRVTLLRRWQSHSGPASLRQPDRNRLLGRACAVLSFADVMDLFANELTRLGRRGFSFALALPGSLDRLSLRHELLQEKGQNRYNDDGSGGHTRAGNTARAGASPSRTRSRNAGRRLLALGFSAAMTF